MDTMSDKSLRISIVVISLLFIWVLVLFSNQTNENKKNKVEIELLRQENDTLRIQKDSLYWELFPVQVELGRYQVAYEIFMERNPKAAKEYGTIISEETE